MKKIFFFTFLIWRVLFFSFVYASTQEASTSISVPSAPINLAVSVLDLSADFSWSAPISNGGSAITDYIIEYKLTNGGIWTVFSDEVNTLTKTTVNNLANNNSYTFRVSAVNGEGRGELSSLISAITGPPAQIVIMSFSDLIVPSIATNVQITNEGVTVYEYHYTWCVTDSDINLCGGGDDIFKAIASKKILPGENFNTTLNSTVPTAGNYWFHLSVTFGSDSSNAMQSFAAVKEKLGGGGGGGAVINTSIAPQTGVPIGADFNNDNKVNSIDFSIMLAFWKTPFPFKNPYVDINGDNQVNSADFSILLYQWGNKPIAFNK